ncbi:MAG TPA: hypothetical protein VMD99_13605 [Terriglobales bacterium]|nr:hypothetical protein [Terriglobales bacterium]
MLLVTSLLSWSSLAVGKGYAQDRSATEASQSSGRRVQQLLSDDQIEDVEAVRRIFELGGEAVPALVSALREGTDVERASRAFVYVGGPEERKILRELVATEKNPEKKWVMAGFLAGALVEPVSREEWNFLQSCVEGYNDQAQGYASFSAALALGINASPRALQLLQSVASAGQKSGSENDTVEESEQATRWANRRSALKVSTPNENQAVSDVIKQTILRDAFFAVGGAKKVSFGEISFTENRTRVLVSLEVPARNGNPQGYDVLLQRRAGVWKIVGAWFAWAA